VFRYLAEPTFRGPEALVFDGFVGDDAPVACRSYLFFTRWLEIFVTFDAHLRPLADATAPFPFAFNCDLTTPYYQVGQLLFTTDLCVDILVAADGRSYQVKDTAEYEHWYRDGAFGQGWYDGVQRELAALTALLETNQFLPFLHAIAPFPAHWPTSQLSTYVQGDLAAAPFVDHPRYPRYG